MTETDRWNIQK